MIIYYQLPEVNTSGMNGARATSKEVNRGKVYGGWGGGRGLGG